MKYAFNVKGKTAEEAVSQLLEFLGEKFNDLHKKEMMASLDKKTIKEARFCEGKASAFSTANTIVNMIEVINE